jgi:hippurate hydrolase
MSAADSIRVTVYGRGGHGSMPQNTVDPVVLAAMITIRLQTIVSREVAPDDTAVVTVGSSRAGTRNNVTPDFAVLTIFSFPVTDNDAAVTGRVARAFTAHFGDRDTLQPTLRTGTEALTAAALAWLAP